MDGWEINVNFQFVIQNHLMIHYLVLELKMENAFHQIIVLAIQDIHHLIVQYIIVIIKVIMIQQFVLEMEIVFQKKHVIVIMDGILKTVKHKCVI
jgi:hypothetical protein